MVKKLKQALIQVLESSRKKIDFKNVNYLPRWAILCFDTIILVIALLTTNVIVNKLQKTYNFSVLFSKRKYLIFYTL